MHSYKELIVWQKAVDLVVATYGLTESFPNHELYGLSSQMRRAAVSIPSSIAEGRRRRTKPDYRRLRFAVGCLQTQFRALTKITTLGKGTVFCIVRRNEHLSIRSFSVGGS